MTLDQFQLHDPQAVVDFILDAALDTEGDILFHLTEDEEKMLKSINRRRFTGEPTSAQDLHELRILYWQVVGFLRASRN